MLAPPDRGNPLALTGNQRALENKTPTLKRSIPSTADKSAARRRGAVAG